MRLLLVTNTADGIFQSSVSRGAAEVLARRKLTLEVLEAPVDRRELESAAGVLVLANVLPALLLKELHGSGVALTLVSHSLPGTRLPTVMHDNHQGMTQLLDYLFDELSCSRPLLLGGDDSQLDAVEREQAFRDNLMRRGLDPGRHDVVNGAFEPVVAAARLEEYLESGPDFDCIASADYLMALAALPVLRAAGRPALPVVGFGDGPEAEQAGLTTVAADVVELGRRAARQLLGQLRGTAPGRPISGRTLLATQLVRRQARPAAKYSVVGGGSQGTDSQ